MYKLILVDISLYVCVCMYVYIYIHIYYYDISIAMNYTYVSTANDHSVWSRGFAKHQLREKDTLVPL